MLSQRTTRARYTTRYEPGHLLANRQGIIKLCRLVLYEKTGPDPQPCHWCGTLLVWKALSRDKGLHGAIVADHVNGDTTDDRPDNLVVSCQWCNANRSRMIRADELSVATSAGRTRAVELTCATCGKQFLARRAVADKRKACSKECSRGLARYIQDGEAIASISGGRRTRGVERTCLVCGDRFAVPLAIARRPNGGRYCSAVCLYRRNRAPVQHD